MSGLTIRAFEEGDRKSVISLWRACDLVTEANNADRDIDRKLDVQPELFLVGESGGQVAATVMVGYDGHRGWINYLATDPAHQGKGFGRAMMQAAEELLAEHGCPKINLQIRSGNESVQAFYEAVGYAVEDRVSMGKRIER